MRLENKTILITGASSGIGEALAEELADIKCKLILLARRTDKLAQIKENLSRKISDVRIYSCDVSNKKEVFENADKIRNEVGEIDIAILNAGAGERITPENFNSGDAEKIFGANFFGIVYWVEQLLPGFMKRRSGTIIGVTSMADNRGYSGSGFYSASKAAATTFLEGLRVELDSYNVKVVTVRPGFVKTPMTDKNEFKMPFIMTTDNAAKIIVKGIVKEKRYIDFPKSMFIITSIIGALPRSVYEYLARKQYKTMRKTDER